MGIERAIVVPVIVGTGHFPSPQDNPGKRHQGEHPPIVCPDRDRAIEKAVESLADAHDQGGLPDRRHPGGPQRKAVGRGPGLDQQPRPIHACHDAGDERVDRQDRDADPGCLGGARGGGEPGGQGGQDDQDCRPNGPSGEAGATRRAGENFVHGVSNREELCYSISFVFWTHNRPRF